MKHKHKLMIIMSFLLAITFVYIVYKKLFNSHQLLLDSLYSNQHNFLDTDNIRLVSDKNCYTKDEVVTLFFVNETEDEYFFGEQYILEMFNNNKWNYVSPDNGIQMFDMVLTHLPPVSKTDNFDVKLSDHFSKLSSGIYRIYKEIKDISGKSSILYVEFELE